MVRRTERGDESVVTGHSFASASPEGMDPASIEIRPLATPKERDACVELQRSTWKRLRLPGWRGERYAVRPATCRQSRVRAVRACSELSTANERGRRSAHVKTRKPRQTEKDEPQPQVLLALGFLMTN